MNATATIPETIRNGVDTHQLFGTLDAVKADPSIAKFRCSTSPRARNSAPPSSTWSRTASP
jgi:hypothetical protein